MNLAASELRERIREALPLAEVMAHDGIELRKTGPTTHGCLCPFHGEKTPSFKAGGKALDRGHCFGCGWSGDIFQYWQARRGVDFKQSLQDLAGLAGIACAGVVYERPAPGSRPLRSPERLVQRATVKPPLPPLRMLTEAECAQLARARGLSVEAVKVAAYQFKRIMASMWPLYEAHGGEWLPRSQGAWPSWVSVDDTRNVGEFRRLDGQKYPRHDGSGIKAWSTSGKNWPLGVTQIGTKVNVLFVEGGPDALAGFHFLHRWDLLDHVAVVCMLGASNSIRQEARAAFHAKRVRIVMDADPVRADGRAAGIEAAGRWQDQLTAAGAVVESFSLYGLSLPDGRAVKDLNDLALCAAEVREAAEIRDAFTAWDF